MQATTFKEFYERFRRGSGGNTNAAGFNKIMNATTHFEEQVKALDNPDRTILIAIPETQVRVIHMD